MLTRSTTGVNGLDALQGEGKRGESQTRWREWKSGDEQKDMGDKVKEEARRIREGWEAFEEKRPRKERETESHIEKDCILCWIHVWGVQEKTGKELDRNRAIRNLGGQEGDAFCSGMRKASFSHNVSCLYDCFPRLCYNSLVTLSSRGLLSSCGCFACPSVLIVSKA